MKIRDGFVSNSSSTSFMVAFVPEDGDLNLKTFQFLLGQHKDTTINRCSVKAAKVLLNELNHARSNKPKERIYCYRYGRLCEEYEDDANKRNIQAYLADM